MPAEGFWAGVRKLCDETGALLVIDDVRAGFRLDMAGSDHYFGFEADLICFCKAIANGYNVSALCGKDAFKNAVSSLSYTGSYWMSAVPFAAGIACIQKMKAIDLPRVLNEKGKKLTDGLVAVAEKRGHKLIASGAPSLFYLQAGRRRFADAAPALDRRDGQARRVPDQPSQPLHQLRAVGRGHCRDDRDCGRSVRGAIACAADMLEEFLRVS